MSGADANIGAQNVLAEARGPVCGLLTMVFSCLLLAASLLILLYQLPGWRTVYLDHYGPAVPQVTQSVFVCSGFLLGRPYLMPMFLLILSGLICLPLLWRSRANLFIAMAVLAVSLGLFVLIMASTILPVTGIL